MRKQAAVAALRSQREATLARLTRLGDPSWDAPCVPGWRVRDVVAHLVAVDEACCRGRMLSALKSSRDRSSFETWNAGRAAQWAERSPSELVAALDEYGPRFASAVARLPSVVARLPVGGDGDGLLSLAHRRVLDEWLHERDVAAVAHPDDETASAVVPCVGEALAAAAFDAVVHRVLPRVDRTAGVVRLVVETGEDARRTWGVDYARRQYGPRVTARPDAVVRTDAPLLALLVEGRVDAAQAPAGRLTVEGDASVASGFLDAVASQR